MQYLANIQVPNRERRLTHKDYYLTESVKIPTWMPYGVFDSRFLAHIQTQVPSCVIYMWDFAAKGFDASELEQFRRNQ